MSSELAIVITARNLAQQTLSQLDGQLKGLEQSSNFASRGFSGLQGVVGTGLKAAAGLGAAGLGALGAAAGSSVTQAANFEQAMANVGAVSRATDADMTRLSAAAKEMGATTAFTAKEAADGMAFLAMAGFNVDQTLQALPAVLAAASAGNIDLATTADIVSNVLGGLRLEAVEAGRVADVLAMASSKSNTSIEMLGQTMKFAAPAAANLGFSLEEVTAAAGFMADAGIQSSLAGTHLRAIFASLSTPTEAAAKAMMELGIEVRNSDGTMRDFTNIVGQFENKLADAGAAQKDFALNAVFGREAAGSFSILLGRGAESLRGYTTELQGAGGAAQEMADRQLNTLRGAMTLFGSAVDGVKVSIGEKFLPVLTAGVRELTSFIDLIGPSLAAAVAISTDAISAFLSMVEAGQDPLRAFVDAMGGFIPADMIARIHDLIDIGIELKNQFVDFITPALNAVAAFISWKDVLMALGIVVASIVLPALWGIVTAAAPVIAIAAALIAGVALLRNAWENDWGGIQTKTMAAIDVIVPLLSELWTWAETKIPEALTALLAVFQTHWPAIQTAVENAWASILVAFEAVSKWLLVTLPTGLAALYTDFQLGWAAIQGFVTGAISNIVGVFETMKTWLTSTLSGAMNTFKSFLGSLALPNPFAGLASVIEAIPTALDSLRNKVNEIKNFLGSVSIPNPFAGISMPSMPSWLGGSGANAAGSGFFTGGLTLVGERGPEMVMLPRGSRIESSERTQRMMGGEAVTVNNYFTVTSDLDIEAAAYKIVKRIQERSR